MAERTADQMQMVCGSQKFRTDNARGVSWVLGCSGALQKVMGVYGGCWAHTKVAEPAAGQLSNGCDAERNMWAPFTIRQPNYLSLWVGVRAVVKGYVIRESPELWCCGESCHFGSGVRP